MNTVWNGERPRRSRVSHVRQGTEQPHFWAYTSVPRFRDPWFPWAPVPLRRAGALCWGLAIRAVQGDYCMSFAIKPIRPSRMAAAPTAMRNMGSWNGRKSLFNMSSLLDRDTVLQTSCRSPKGKACRGLCLTACPAPSVPGRMAGSDSIHRIQEGVIAQERP